MQKKQFAFCFVLFSLPVGIITYQLAMQEVENPVQIIETNVAVEEIAIINDVKPNSGTERSITIKNDINKKMITYRKGFISMTPNFSLTVNNQPLALGKQINLPVVDQKITVTYAYDFMGHKKGKKSILFDVPTDKDTLNITFSWDKEPRVSLSDAKALEVKEIY